jgi:photosystem II stability/assembly factor-like uncharacterized protein
VILAVGTKRGLFLLTSRDRRAWKGEGPFLAGHRIFHAMIDRRNGARLFAADNGDFFGSYLRYSDNLGRTWKEPTRGIAFPGGGDLALKNIWIIEPGRADDPKTVYCGVDPAALFVSRDGGDTWELNHGLEHHNTRGRWQPGAGGLCLNSIVVHPTNPRRMWVAISAVGVMRTDDGGNTWLFCNKGTRADFLPEKFPEFGQCVHRLIRHPVKPDVLYQQNHCSVYMSANAGNSWVEIRGNLPSDFGFPMALDVHHPETLYTVVEDPEGRTNFGNQFTVYRTENAGKRWTALTKGLPKGPTVKLGVLRHALCADTRDPCGVYVGTNTGQLFASRDRGDSWKMVADYLPPIYSVAAAVL